MKPRVPFLHCYIDNLQFYCLLLPFALTFLPSYVERCQMFSHNQSRLYLNYCSFSYITHILLQISIINPCNFYFQGDIILLWCSKFCLSLLWKFFIIPVSVLYTVYKHVICWQFLTSLLSLYCGSKYIIPVVSQSGTFSDSSIIALQLFLICMLEAGYT